MMKKLFLMAACALALLACNKTPDDPTPTPESINVVGEWQLSNISTKATIGGQTVNVYVSFTQDGKFELYQQLGTGWYKYFDGTWKLNGKELSGSYSNGKAWGSAYTVTQSGNTLTLTTASGKETDTYTKTTIPDSVKQMTEY